MVYTQARHSVGSESVVVSENCLQRGEVDHEFSITKPYLPSLPFFKTRSSLLTRPPNFTESPLPVSEP